MVGRWHLPASLTPARSRASESGWNGEVAGHHAAREARLAWRRRGGRTGNPPAWYRRGGWQGWHADVPEFERRFLGPHALTGDQPSAGSPRVAGRWQERLAYRPAGAIPPAP